MFALETDNMDGDNDILFADLIQREERGEPLNSEEKTRWMSKFFHGIDGFINREKFSLDAISSSLSYRTLAQGGLNNDVKLFEILYNEIPLAVGIGDGERCTFKVFDRSAAAVLAKKLPRTIENTSNIYSAIEQVSLYEEYDDFLGALPGIYINEETLEVREAEPKTLLTLESEDERIRVDSLSSGGWIVHSERNGEKHESYHTEKDDLDFDLGNRINAMGSKGKTILTNTTTGERYVTPAQGEKFRLLITQQNKDTVSQYLKSATSVTLDDLLDKEPLKAEPPIGSDLKFFLLAQYFKHSDAAFSNSFYNQWNKEAKDQIGDFDVSVVSRAGNQHLVRFDFQQQPLGFLAGKMFLNIERSRINQCEFSQIVADREVQARAMQAIADRVPEVQFESSVNQETDLSSVLKF